MPVPTIPIAVRTWRNDMPSAASRCYLEQLLVGNRTLVIMYHRGTSNTHVLSRGWWKDAADIMAVAKHLGLEVAHSAGTRAAIAVQTRFPNRIRSMLLITPPSIWLTQIAHDGATLAARRNEPELFLALSSMEKPSTDENSFQLFAMHSYDLTCKHSDTSLEGLSELVWKVPHYGRRIWAFEQRS